MQLLILLIHVVLAIALVAVVLVQQGKGAEAGASFGGGASQTVFGSRGNSSFLAKLTGVLVALFFISALTLGWMAKHSGGGAQAGLPSADMIQQQHRSTESTQGGDNGAPAQAPQGGQNQQSTDTAQPQQQSGGQAQQPSDSGSGNGLSVPSNNGSDSSK